MSDKIQADGPCSFIHEKWPLVQPIILEQLLGTSFNISLPAVNIVVHNVSFPEQVCEETSYDSKVFRYDSGNVPFEFLVGLTMGGVERSLLIRTIVGFNVE